MTNNSISKLGGFDRLQREAISCTSSMQELLKKNAVLLEDQDEPDIDNLMKIVEESMSAYKACKTRVDAVQKALNDTFKE
ncbi:hypothetical protein AVENLUH7437_01169 [Acinetobacter venetianus]|nr:hypothetical protein AVENLUH7437_01169 [Acinetobacter venetianus]